MVSLLETLKIVKEQGYTEDLMRHFCIEGTPILFRLKDFTIDKSLRVDHLSDPEEQTVVHALSSEDGCHKGYIINGYGIYSDPCVDQIVDKLSPT